MQIWVSDILFVVIRQYLFVLRNRCFQNMHKYILVSFSTESNEYKSTLFGVLRTQIILLAHSSPSIYTTLRAHVIT